MPFFISIAYFACSDRFKEEDFDYQIKFDGLDQEHDSDNEKEKGEAEAETERDVYSSSPTIKGKRRRGSTKQIRPINLIERTNTIDFQ